MSAARTRVVGLDFGTTNSAIAVATPGGAVELAKFKTGEDFTTTFRSILYFDGDNLDKNGRPRAVAGPEAIRSYLNSKARGRLIQSVKSYLASRLFKQTNILGHAFSLEDLIAAIVRQLKAAAESQFGDLGGSVVVGRPAHFSGAKTEIDDQFALDRLRAAIEKAGFEQISFELEPVAAAYKYQTQLDHEELVLIADFGGGTSDFSLVRLRPHDGNDGAEAGVIVGTDGVGIAGDTFDGKIVRHVAAPRLGRNSPYRSPFGEVLPVPSWLYEHLEKWHTLSFLKTKRTMELLEELKFQALEPEKISSLMHVVDNDSGYQLYKSVEDAKFKLSAAAATAFVFDDPPVAIAAQVTRGEFEKWIGPETRQIAACIDRLLRRCNAAAGDIDSVFMTGGTSFVPAIRNLFARKFGVSRLRAGEELTSVAKGLAIRALRPHI
jgi:hypothetical chaperone protein